jgi:NAD(P)-dependent dehydrogenase (short-subunit alcohol dehydrogenase family)
MENLKNKVVLVVGGGSGIGLGIGVAFAREGCRVVLAARTASSLEAAKKLPEVGAALLTKTCDSTQRAEVAELVKWVEANAGPVDFLVYAAGVNIPKRTFAEIDPAEFDRVLSINATGAFNSIHAVLPGMRARKAGRIFNVVSLGGVQVLQLAGLPYTASKFAQASIGTFANLETLPDGVSVTNVHPGETETPLVDKRPVPPSAEQRARMLKPEDIAAMLVAVAKLPPRATVPEIVIAPRHMPLIR